MEINKDFKCNIIWFNDEREYNEFFLSKTKVLSVYCLPEYMFAWANYDRSKVCLLELQTEFGNAYIAFLSNNISDEGHELYSAYGYGGFFSFLDFSNNEAVKKIINANFNRINTFLKEQGVIDIFVRNSPFSNNCTFFPNQYLYFDRQTVSVDLKEWKDVEFPAYFTSKEKWGTRYALRNNLQVKFFSPELCPESDFKIFYSLYNETMLKNDAKEYYFFSKELFNAHLKLRNNLLINFIYYNNNLIGGSLFLYDETTAHYHLSAIDYAFRKYQASDLILYSACKHFEKMGKSTLHLGGGRSVDSDDSLFRFKNRFGKLIRTYYISKLVVDEEKYYKIRKNNDLCNSNRFLIKDALLGNHGNR